MDRRERLEKVILQADVYMACIQHALSTEHFEVMGMLLGVSQDSIATIMSLVIMRRSDKKKDRVEISSLQQCAAATEAEKLAEKLNLPVRVLGWYHSHPHITVCPSHVDVGTQAMHQQMDSKFFGLIFSVFSEEKDSKTQEVQLTCFQSFNQEAIEIPLEISYTLNISADCLQTMASLPKILVQEEEELAEARKDHHDILASVYNNAVLTKSLAHITDMVTRPLMQTLTDRILLNKLRSLHLRKTKRELEEKFSSQF
ncbi:lys-63-specific deubiquitinase BRCC36-like [Leptopilina heterotoma]|uniref:lys-63-specific deubiquitinase BRCC36-like n=1 Tax=Leptopilina heterotoma TaxID=63436 RepID=UPI001CA8235C|nr:lys-63-specific deubiquitinase BRCC36-like [Leptopilina heterotoma]XP_043464778.1 lys-63-specific deubiquitinase BRCC36-like [Leptopilina heterotoma]